MEIIFINFKKPERDTSIKYMYPILVFIFICLPFFSYGEANKVSPSHWDVTETVNARNMIETNYENQSGTQDSQKRVTGVITDEKGEPLFGANVVERGTTNGVITDTKGNFSILTEENAILQISYIGYLAQEISVSGKSSLDIKLFEDLQFLDEVVVVGYGVQKKASVTGSIASIKTDEITVSKAASVTNALAGKLPGLRAVQRSGTPGNDLATIDIRGYGSPLIIVDGVERNFSYLNPNDIESISILKDASASVYGFKGANGVILVTTKKGELEKPKISYNGYWGFQKETRLAKLYNSYEYATLWNEAQVNVGVKAPFSQEEIEKFKAGNDPKYPNNNWWDLMTRDFAPQTYHNLSVSGGNEVTKYYFSLGFLHQEAIWASKEEEYNRYNVRSTVNTKITKDLSIELQLSGRFDNRFAPNGTGSLFTSYYKVQPVMPIYANNNPNYYYYIGDNINPIQGLYSDELGYNKRDRREFNGSLILNWKIPWINGLNAKALVAYDYNNSFTKDWAKEYSAFLYNETTDVYSQYFRRSLSTLNSRSDNSFSTTQQYSLNYLKTLNSQHNIAGLLLFEMKNYRLDWVSASRQFFISAVDQMNAGDNINKDNGGTQSESANMGLVGRLNYDYINKYLLEVSFRYDGSYKFYEDRRWGFFPSVSLGWRISEEPFFKEKLSFVNNLKIRGSYGKIGDEASLSAFEYVTGYNYPSTNYILGSGGVLSGVVDRGLANTNLTWYDATIANIGFETNIYNGLISAEFDYFVRWREGLLARRTLSLPTSFGQTLPQENLNSDMNRGFELVLGHHKKIGDLTYSIKANFTSARELNSYIESAVPANLYENWRNNTNDRYKSMTWGYIATGQFQSFEEILNAPIQDGNGNKSLLPGDIRYKDLNGDGIIDNLDQKPISRGDTPSMYYGLNLNVMWKNFDFTTYFQGAAGHYLFLEESFTEPFIQRGMGNGVVFWLDHWHRENPEDLNSAWVPGYMPAVRPTGFALNDAASTWSILDQKYLRLKTIELGYRVPKAWLSKIGIDNLRIYANGLNILTFTQGRRMKYMDPETNARRQTSYPPMKSFNFGLDLTF